MTKDASQALFINEKRKEERKRMRRFERLEGKAKQ